LICLCWDINCCEQTQYTSLKREDTIVIHNLRGQAKPEESTVRVLPTQTFMQASFEMHAVIRKYIHTEAYTDYATPS